MGKRTKFRGILSRNKQTDATEDSNKQTSGLGMSNLGFFGGVTSGVRCDADDKSFFCQLTKFTAIISQLLFLVGVLLMVYFIGKYILLPLLFGKGKQRRGSSFK